MGVSFANIEKNKFKSNLMDYSNRVNSLNNDDFVDYFQETHSSSDVLVALSKLNFTDKKLLDTNNIDKNEETLHNIRTTVLFFTQYCGPGARLWNRIFKSDERTYMDVDYCCKKHDECPHYVEKFDDYYRYPGLEYRPQFFSRFESTRQ